MVSKMYIILTEFVFEFYELKPTLYISNKKTIQHSMRHNIRKSICDSMRLLKKLLDKKSKCFLNIKIIT